MNRSYIPFLVWLVMNVLGTLGIVGRVCCLSCLLLELFLVGCFEKEFPFLICMTGFCVWIVLHFSDELCEVLEKICNCHLLPLLMCILETFLSGLVPLHKILLSWTEQWLNVNEHQGFDPVREHFGPIYVALISSVVECNEYVYLIYLSLCGELFFRLKI